MNIFVQEFYDLETALLKPEIRSSREELDRLLVDDFVEFGSSGSVYQKQDTLASLTTTTDNVVYEVSDFEVRKISEDAVLTTFKTKPTINDTDVTIALRSSIWKKIEGNWRMFFHQGTLVRR